MFEENGTPDDCATDFKHDRERPAKCSECGREFPMSRVDEADLDPLCPDCKYFDWCDICGCTECCCSDDNPDD